ICYGSGSWCLSTWKVSLVMLRAVETFWEIFRICKTPGFLQHSWRLSIGDSYKAARNIDTVPLPARQMHSSSLFAVRGVHAVRPAAYIGSRDASPQALRGVLHDGWCLLL